VRATFLAEWVSMNCVLSLVVFIGLAVAYPVNVWLVRNHLTHGMGTVRALGHGGTPAPAATSSATLTKPAPAAHDGHTMTESILATTTEQAPPDPAPTAMDMAERQTVTSAQSVAVVVLTLTTLARASCSPPPTATSGFISLTAQSPTSRCKRRETTTDVDGRG
jgi:hypothetical protein